MPWATWMTSPFDAAETAAEIVEKHPETFLFTQSVAPAAIWENKDAPAKIPAVRAILLYDIFPPERIGFLLNKHYHNDRDTKSTVLEEVPEKFGFLRWRFASR